MVSDAKACNSESNVVLLLLRTGNHSYVYSSYLCCLSRYLTIVAPITASSAWRAKKTDSRWKFETMTINGAHVVGVNDLQDDHYETARVSMYFVGGLSIELRFLNIYRLF